ncbi:MAG: transposase family protein, partial [Proteobacteria bacterium]|nr:transposase family protein [Pseudomonadota bacterium]
AVETRLLMTLEYWREYRTYLHIGHSYRSTHRHGLPWPTKTSRQDHHAEKTQQK